MVRRGSSFVGFSNFFSSEQTEEEECRHEKERMGWSISDVGVRRLDENVDVHSGVYLVCGVSWECCGMEYFSKTPRELFWAW